MPINYYPTGKDKKKQTEIQYVWGLGVSAQVTTSATDAGAGVTIHAFAGKVTSQSLATAAGSAATITVTNNQVLATDIVLISQNGGTQTTGTPIIKAVPANGSFVITLTNAHASAAFNGTFILGFTIVRVTP